MATSKSTVVGIRLDHDRRAWIEAEAARRGVSVRGLFEGMIDGARSGENEDAAYEEVAEAESALAPGVGRGSASGLADASNGNEWLAAASDSGVNARSAVNAPTNPLADAASQRTPDSSAWPDFGSVTALPGGLVRGAFSVTTGLIKTGGRCARDRVEHCPLTRLFVDRSL
jgi:hypothetical protein